MLRIYVVILEVLKMLKPLIDKIRRHDGNLADQLGRASTSVALNTSEGFYSRGKNVKARFNDALASAGESRSCVEVAARLEYIPPLDPVLAKKLDHVIATLFKLAKR